MSLLGRHSYAIYLSHFALVPAISARVPLDLIFLFALVTGLSLALSYYLIEPLIERRFNRFGHGLASRVRQPRIVATAA
jgi:peptidoglycan/LPS O-acetylase OafA/YrhL